MTWHKNKKSVFSGPWHWKHDIYKTESDAAAEKRCISRTSRPESRSLLLKFHFLVNKFDGFSCHFPFLWNEEWKERYCILTRVFPLERFFFFKYIYFYIFLYIFIYIFFYLDSLSIDLGPRPSRQRYYYVEMCQRVLKTLRRMVNIKVFYKKVYNHLDIYTNTQIYIHIYVYTFL